MTKGSEQVTEEILPHHSNCEEEEKRLRDEDEELKKMEVKP
jgi:hypothetical protein